ncbi:MAG: flavodoxin domain-containing protein [Candidatus Verstraetearchaeota archaeon]|nr:flavodoxin domain-containing protein [Candidatus Verstraetearchaeota archaeon]
MTKIEISDGVFWVGAVDWDVRNFHGFSYTTHRGTSYNAYLIVDEKIALVDTVYKPFSDEMFDRIREIVDPSRIDYVVMNHVETDHSSSLTEVMKAAPRAKVLGTARCKAGLEKHYFCKMDFQTVKTGDELRLGRKTLMFIEAPMLHWPDSMFTYVKEEGLLLPNDAFGQHLASSGRFDDQVDSHVLMEEAAKYYANILLPLSPLVKKKIDEIVGMKIPIKTIAPSHGVIWRKDPMKIVEAYLRWSTGATEKRVVIAYDTMWGSTERMARAILEGISSEGVDARLYRLPYSDTSDIIGELLNSRGLLVGSSTINNGILPTLAPLLTDLRGLKPKGRLAAAFGSYGWMGGATEEIEAALREAGMEIAMPAMKVNWVPTEEELKQCVSFGREFARKL